MSYTPGPWHLHRNQSSPGFRIDSQGNEWQGLAKVYQAPGLEAQGEANAALIAASPEGYELLASMREWAEGEALDPSSEDHAFAVKILAYLAKAEGRHHE